MMGEVATNGRRLLLAAVLAAVALVTLTGGPASPAFAATFTVNTTTDEVDPNPGDGLCQIEGNPGQCSLRAAIMEANALPGADTILLDAGDYNLTTGPAGDTGAAADDLDITDSLTIAGVDNDDTIIDALGLGRVFDVDPLGTGITVHLKDLGVTGGASTGHGGGIQNRGHLTLTRVRVTDNTALGDGGGIYNAAGATLVMFDSNIGDTQPPFGGNAAARGGGLFNAGSADATFTRGYIAGNQSSDDEAEDPGDGGGVLSFGTLLVEQASIDNNIAYGDGGGIAVAGGDTTLVNVNISDNQALDDAGFGSGGGLAHYGDGTVSLNNVTIADNIADVDGGGVYTTGDVDFGNTIIADNAAVNDGPDCIVGGAGSLNSLDYNLIEDPTDCTVSGTTTNNVIDDPELGPLVDNGGRSWTKAISDTSPARNAGDNGSCAAVDQRGVPRPLGGDCDIGSFEFGAIVVDTTTDADDAAPLDGTCETAGNECSLRAAIQTANAADGGIILVPVGEYLLSEGEVDITAASLVLIGSGQDWTFIQGDGTRVFDIAALTNVEISALTITDGEVDSEGGAGIRNAGDLYLERVYLRDNEATDGANGGALLNQGSAELLDVWFEGNTAEGAGASGGALFNTSSAELDIQNSTLTTNGAINGGAIANAGVMFIGRTTIAGNAATTGGGIHNSGSDADLEVEASTISGNDADNGGGLANRASATALAVNVTISGNEATGAGGGVFNDGGTVSLSNATVADNTAGGQGGGLRNVSPADTTLANSILAGNTGNGPDCSGEIESDGYNLIEDVGSCSITGDATGNITGQSAQLFPLGGNGGDTETHALGLSSPAVDAANGTCADDDQRGVERPQGEGCDMGAFEQRVFAVDVLGDGFDADLGDEECATNAPSCTLRAAIQEANALPGPDRVVLGDGTHQLAIGGAGDDAAHTGDLDITDHLVVTGDDTTSINGNDLDRVLQVLRPATEVLLRDLSVANGNTGEDGGGIHNGGVLTLEAVTVGENVGDQGGGVASTGPLTLDGASIILNSADSNGGGLAVFGVTVITGSEIAANHAANNGGGIYNGASGLLQVEDSSIGGNGAEGNGAGVHQTGGPSSISQTTIEENGSPFAVLGGDVGASGEPLPGDGGGVFVASGSTLTLDQVLIADNEAGAGGGLRNEGSVTLTDSTVEGNEASVSGGGASNTGSLQVVRSTFSNNEATANGGGISSSGGTLGLSNSTVSGNVADQSGGGVFNQAPSVTTLTNVTVADNDAGTGTGGGVANGAGATLTFQNTLIALNRDDNEGGASPDCSGSLASNGHNLLSDAANCTITGITASNVIAPDPLLGPLADNGGLTETHALLAGSPAIGGGDNAQCPATDQRGVLRPQGANCDIGAYEARLMEVDTTDDGPDAGPGDGICATAENECSLRAAIQEANASPGADIIEVPNGTYTLALLGDNEDEAATGDLDITDTVTINGAGQQATIIDGNNTDRVFDVLVGSTDVPVTIRNLTIQNGNALSGSGLGGGIFNDGDLTLERVAVLSSVADASGGGIANEGVLTLFEVTVHLNEAASGSGGGLVNSGEAFVDRSTFSNNVANLNGGAIYNAEGAELEMANSTISTNGADDDGGGIHNNEGIAEDGSVNLNNVTIAFNVADNDDDGNGDGGGIHNEDDANLVLSNTIVAGNEDGSGGGPDCFGDLVSAGFNLIQDTTGCSLGGDTAGNVTGLDPLLGPLTDNGGPTNTHALDFLSPAVDAGNDLTCEPVDQRGVERPFDGDFEPGAVCDIGAFELSELPPAADLEVTKVPADEGYIAGDDVVFTITVTNHGPDTATGVTLRDAVPDGVEYVNATSTQGVCGLVEGEVICDIGPMLLDAVVTVTLTVRAPDAGEVENTAIVELTEVDPDEENNADTAVATVDPLQVPLFEGWFLVDPWPGQTVNGVAAIITFLNGAAQPNLWLSIAHYDIQDAVWLLTFKDAPLPSFNTLLVIEEGEGYWVYSADNIQLVFTSVP